MYERRPRRSMRRQALLIALAVGAALARPAAAVNSVSGSALGVSGSVTGVGTVAPNPTVVLPPNGGAVEGHLLGLSVPNILSTGALTADSNGTIGVNMATTVSDAAIAQLNVLNGLVTADVVLSRASCTGDGSTAACTSA